MKIKNFDVYENAIEPIFENLKINFNILELIVTLQKIELDPYEFMELLTSGLEFYQTSSTEGDLINSKYALQYEYFFSTYFKIGQKHFIMIILPYEKDNPKFIHIIPIPPPAQYYSVFAPIKPITNERFIKKIVRKYSKKKKK